MAEIIFVLARNRQIPEVYGGEQSTLATASRLASSGHSAAFVITAKDKFALALDGFGIPYEVVDIFDPFEGLRAASLRERLRRVCGLVRANAAVWRKARKVPAVVVHTTAIPGFFCGWFGAKLAGAKVIYQVRGASRSSRTRWFETVAILLADRTLTVSNGLRDQLLQTGNAWLRPRLAPRIRPLYTGFDFATIDALITAESTEVCRKATARSGRRVNAILVGGISVDKGQLRFLQNVLPAVVAAAPEFHITFVGGSKDGSYMAACQAAIDSAGLREHVLFTGYLPLSQVYHWYRGSDLAVLPSEREGLPRSAIEAEAFGLPVVATAAVGSAEAIVDGVTGYLVPSDHIRGMIEPILRLVRDAGLRAKLGGAGAHHVRTRFSFDRHMEELASVYDALTGRSPSQRK